MDFKKTNGLYKVDSTEYTRNYYVDDEERRINSEENVRNDEAEEEESLTSDINSSQRSKRKSRMISLYSDLKNTDLPDEVKKKADEIFQSMNCTTKRGRKKYLLLFYCVYYAYLELGHPQPAFFIANKFGVNVHEISKALSLFSEAQTGYRPPEINVSPTHFLPQYCNDLHFSPDTTQAVMSLADEILNKDPSLCDESPNKVAAGILFYFMKIHGVSFSKDDFSKLINLSEVTINNIYKKIAEVHNR